MSSRIHTASKREPRWPRFSRGVAAVEFVVAVPILIFVMLALAELGRAVVQYDALTYAVRNGARYVSENALAGTSGVVDITPAVAARAKQLVVSANQLGTTPGRILPGLAVSHVTVEEADDLHVRVVVDYPYHPLIGNVLPAVGTGGSVDTAMTFHVAVTMRAIY